MLLFDLQNNLPSLLLNRLWRNLPGRPPCKRIECPETCLIRSSSNFFFNNCSPSPIWLWRVVSVTCNILVKIIWIGRVHELGFFLKSSRNLLNENLNIKIEITKNCEMNYIATRLRSVARNETVLNFDGTC